MKKYYTFILLAAAVIVGAMIWWMYYSSPNPYSGGQGSTAAVQTGSQSGSGTVYSEAPTPSRNLGRAVFTLSDAAVALNDLRSLYLPVNAVRIHNAKGWTTVLSVPQVYDLLSLYSLRRHVVVADVKLEAGTYDQVALTLGEVGLTTNHGQAEIAVVPSKEIKMATNLTVTKGGISSLALDFLSGQSLFTAPDGQYIFAPVVKLDTLSSVSSTQIFPQTHAIEVFGGVSNFNGTYGMDEMGVMKLGFSFEPITVFQVVNGSVKVIAK